MFVLRRYFYLLPAVLLFVTVSAHAAGPDTGTLLNEQRQPGIKLPDRLPKPDSPAQERPPLADSGVKVTAKAFRFTGYESIATETELQALVKDSVGKELSFPDLQNLVVGITSYLREKKGYLLARAYLPRQDLTEGVIEIAIVAGRLDDSTDIRMKGPARIKVSKLREMVEKAVPPGKAIQTRDIERAILLMNDLSGIKAQASLEPGSAPGTTRVVVNASEGPLLSGMLSGDNYGDRYTGTWRGTGTALVNDPFGWGDQLALALTGAENQFQGRFSYALPLGSDGFNWSFGYTNLSYKLGGDLRNLNYTGSADTFSTGISYPLLRSRSASIWSGLGFEYLFLTDKMSGDKIKDRKIPVGNGFISGTFYDQLGGGGMTSVNVTLYGGHLDLSSVTAAQVQDAAGPKAEGGFFKGTYGLARLQQITQSLYAFVSARGQVAGGNLDSSQKFILGGPTGIRAYPVGEAAGDEGHAFTAEMRYDLPFTPAWAATQLVGFLDTGWIKLNQSNWPGAVTNASGKNDYWLSGAGVGLNIGKTGIYSIRGSYAHTIDTNYGRSTTGMNADNLNDKERFWLQALLWF
ncbi:MAG: ShlB/FhaC/HecB family hemolysin secretion/activation protein [Deltaproteobacteria bacterium HGW-Deltaproteobacteria-6]|nr:MAG: ShlB/FhaC/HecB family hemolysin secretion/activation protein [Deltaproteobacteria bacterium HGW-Deltaproteobacteria-6]